MKTFLTAGLAAVAMLVAASTAQADLLLNGSFETPVDTGAASPGNWYTFASAGAAGAGNSTLNPLTGSMNGQTNIANDPDQFTGMQQLINGITPGEEYTFDIFALATDSNGMAQMDATVNAEFRIEWTIDGMSQGAGNNVAIGGSLTDTYQQFSTTLVAPDGVNGLLAVFAVQSFGGLENPDGGVAWDDASVTGPSAVPEPGSLALFGLSALGLISRRRRS